MIHLPRTSHPDSEEMRAVQYIEILPYVPLFSHQGQGRGFVKTSPMCSLSDVLDSCPSRALSASWETDGLSICLDKRWETIRLTVKDRNPSRVSVTLFSNDVLELGQHWKKMAVCCMPLTYIRAILKVSVERKLIYAWHWWDVPLGHSGRSIQEMSTVVLRQLTFGH